MHDIWMRVMGNFSHRISGPMNFRFILQPLIALIFAAIDGRKDAKAGKSLYFWSLFTEPQHRAELLRDGWESIAKIFSMAIVLDVIFQTRELHTIYPGEALIVAVLLAILPYLAVRGLTNRFARRR